jgi:TonB-dependent receptor
MPTSGAGAAEKQLPALLCFEFGGGIVFLQPVSETGRRNKRVSRQDGSEGGPLSKSKRARACNKAHFQRQVLRLKPVAAFVAVCCSGAALAAEGPDATAPAASDVQEVVITGLRQSLVNAESIKRDASGVVDAITAEDIGKFPDTNLAEAIQRIPGVTIDRNNNEGSRVTVRGFGPEFNLVTLNGRSMPGNVDLLNNQTATRSFDFENLSADGISGIEVYKTGRADIASGGIGSTIDIKTARPFDFSDMRATFSAKANRDASTEVGNKVTPEFSGLFSDKFFDDRVGFLINGSYSKRNSEEQTSGVDGWLQNQIGPGAGNSPTLALTNNNNNPYGNNWAPRDDNWGITDHSRSRTNGQAVLQFKPVDSVVATADYTYTYYKDIVDRHTWGAWFDYGPNPYSATINSEGTVTHLVDTGSDLSYSSFADTFIEQNGSAGFNLKWAAADNLDVELDAHHSFANTDGGASGNNDFGIVGQWPALSLTKTFNLGQYQLPTTSWTYAAPYNTSNLTTSTITPLFGQANNTVFYNIIDQARIGLTWKNGNADSGLKSIKLGFDWEKFQTRAATYNSGNFAWGYYNAVSPNNYNGLIPASDFTKVSSCTILKQFSGGSCQIAVPYFYTYNLQNVIAITQHGGNLNPPDPTFPPYTFAQAATPTNDDHIREVTPAPYLQFDFSTDFNGMPFKALAGIRYEKTNVTANSLQKVPTAVVWENPTEFATTYAANATFSDVTSSYGEFLPNLDLSLQVRPDVILRTSYSKTIARSDLTQMVGTTSVTVTPKPGSRTATEGNPGLLPYESNNFDLAAEWYYTKDSYLAANWFVKRVTNFLTESTTQGPLFGITDPNAGAIANKAIAELTAAKQPVTAQTIFAQMVTDNPGQNSFAGQAGDPLVIWDITTPTNGNTTNIHGFEISGQHMFWDSGFGVQANYSAPSGGAPWNPLVVTQQFALAGLSRSYNLVGFFEKWGFQTRVAYTHRSSFLSALNQTDQNNEPIYTAAYGQLDASASYDISRHFSVFFNGINLTSESIRKYGRYTDQFYSASEGFARYQVGFRMTL